MDPFWMAQTLNQPNLLSWAREWRSIKQCGFFQKQNKARLNAELPEALRVLVQNLYHRCVSMKDHIDAVESNNPGGGGEEELQKLLLPDVGSLPLSPPSAVQSNFVSYFAPDFMKPGHDQYVYRHANGLCVIGLAPSHVAFKDKGGVTAVDFNVGKTDRSGIKVTGKRKKNAQHFESNSALCKVCTNDASYIVRCCVKGNLLEVNDRLIKQPGLLNSSADREGYIAIIMPKPADWLKTKASLIDIEEYKKLKEVH